MTTSIPFPLPTNGKIYWLILVLKADKCKQLWLILFLLPDNGKNGQISLIDTCSLFL